MADEFDTFRDHFLSLFQSAVTDVARQIDHRDRGAAKRPSVDGCRESEISRAWFSGKTLTMGVSGEHGGSPDVVMKRPERFTGAVMARCHEPRHTPGGCNGDAPAGPLAKMVRYYRTHLAHHAKRAFSFSPLVRCLLSSAAP